MVIGGCGAHREARPIAAQISPTGVSCKRMARMNASAAGHEKPLGGNVGRPTFSRRAWLVGGGVAATLVAAGLVRRWRRERASVFIAKNQSYRGELVRTIRDGLVACGFAAESIRGKRVLLKPNMVEPIRESPHMTTHPAMVLAAAEVFRGWGASVTIGEGPGHLRDTDLALVESGVGEALDSAKLPFADLNYQDVAWWGNAGKKSKLGGFFFPQAVA